MKKVIEWALYRETAAASVPEGLFRIIGSR